MWEEQCMEKWPVLRQFKVGEGECPERVHGPWTSPPTRHWRVKTQGGNPVEVWYELQIGVVTEWLTDEVVSGKKGLWRDSDLSDWVKDVPWGNLEGIPVVRVKMRGPGCAVEALRFAFADAFSRCKVMEIPGWCRRWFPTRPSHNVLKKEPKSKESVDAMERTRSYSKIYEMYAEARMKCVMEVDGKVTLIDKCVEDTPSEFSRLVKVLADDGMACGEFRQKVRRKEGVHMDVWEAVCIVRGACCEEGVAMKRGGGVLLVEEDTVGGGGGGQTKVPRVL